jgi:hypothetical protein
MAATRLSAGTAWALGADRRLRIRPVPLRRPAGLVGLDLPRGGREAPGGRGAQAAQRRAQGAAQGAARQARLEREARRLGMVKAGEKAYVVRVP